ncbi:FadR/GntR family transcriptional regulator [Desulfomicrobium escambiense]|uniref:FadR/GntR family transcriptional regulator n=1 Tax=Desulfomicrobium escambiense TaxID=29503 RepID=UPI00041D85B7|nr:FadR/GntR family transcriptional regulator [Desulfomicrobium escambiense]
MSTPQQQKRIYEEIAVRLQELVEVDDLQPGDRLPPERRLAELFGVSRNSMREAIKSLEQTGLLKSRPGAGTYIAAASPTELARQLGEAFARERHRLEDIFELRLLLEPQIARLAARRVSPRAIERLDDLMHTYEDAVRHGEPVLEIDQDLHDTIAAATGNHAIVRLMEQMHDMLFESRDETLQSPERSRNALEDHRKILAALRLRDADGACAAMTEHLEHTREIVFTSKKGA